MMQQIFSTGQVAKMLGVARHKVEYAIVNNHLSEARFRFLDKRCFTAEDIHRMAEYFGVEVDLTADMGGSEGS
jgi:hypothetical protein